MSRNRRIELIVGFVAGIAVLVGLGLAIVREPARIVDAGNEILDTQIADATTIYAEQCAVCHALGGEGTSAATVLVGGDMHSEGTPLRTVGSYWPYASTLFDYIRRAMPATAPKSLSDVEVYQVTAYVLYLNGIIDQYKVLNSDSLTEIDMPNKDGFIDFSQTQ